MKINKIIRSIYLFSCTFATAYASLAYSAGGGFGKTTAGLNTFHTWVVIPIRVAAVLALVWQGSQFFMGKAPWEKLLNWVIGAAILAAATEIANLFI